MLAAAYSGACVWLAGSPIASPSRTLWCCGGTRRQARPACCWAASCAQGAVWQGMGCGTLRAGLLLLARLFLVVEHRGAAMFCSRTFLGPVTSLQSAQTCETSLALLLCRVCTYDDVHQAHGLLATHAPCRMLAFNRIFCSGRIGSISTAMAICMGKLVCVGCQIPPLKLSVKMQRGPCA